MRSLFIMLITIFSIPATAQIAIEEFVKENTVEIKTIQPDATNYSDLKQIGDAIGDSRVVMLGEQGHGDGATFLAKSRLVKYLHENKGFNVIAFESDFFALNAGWDQLKKEDEEIKKFLSGNIYPLWSKCAQCSDLLFNYIPDTYQNNNPLKITGFDNQLYLNYTPVNLKEFIDKYLRRQNIPFTQSKTYITNFLPAVDGITKGWLVGKDAELKALEVNIDSILHQLADHRNAYEYLLLQNIQAFASETRNAKDEHKAGEIRDKQMAENLVWLLREKFPNEKVIVWAANAHISKNGTTAFKFKASRKNWMATVFTKDSINNANTYVLGFSSKNGFHKNVFQPAPLKVSKPKKNGFENWIDESYRYAFIDFERFRKENPTFSAYFAMKGHGHSSNVADWTKVFDGVFFIRDMIPCEKLN